MQESTKHMLITWKRLRQSEKRREVIVLRHRETSYKPSTVKLAAKSVLSVLNKILTPKYYNAFYGVIFGAYRALVRAWYSRFVVWYAITGDSEKRDRTALVASVMPFSLVGSRGLESTYEVLRNVQREGVLGSIVECGVAQGGSAALMGVLEAQAGSHRKLWLFDSYEGLPDPTEEDFEESATGRHIRPLPKGSCLGTFERVEDLLFRQFGLSRDNVIMVKGWFEDTLVANRQSVGGVSVLRIDADWYESVKCCLDNFYDQVVPGGYVIVDDYHSCFGAQKAVDGFLTDRGVEAEFTFDGRGGCFFPKPAQGVNGSFE